MSPNQPDFAREFKEQIIFRIQENTPRIIRCLDLLNEEEVWFQANPESNSIANLILHLAGNISQYIISSLGQEKDIRNRNLEFRSKKNFTKDQLIENLSSTCEKAIRIIKGCSEKELSVSRMVQGFELTGIGILIHVAEHYSYHTGQIALTTKLLVQKDLGFYADLDLNIKNG